MKKSTVLLMSTALLLSSTANAQQNKYRTNKATQEVLQIPSEAKLVKTGKQEFPGPIFFPGDLFFPGPIFFPGDLFERVSASREWSGIIFNNAQKYDEVSIIIFNKKSQFRSELKTIAELASTGAKAGREEHPRASKEMQKTVDRLNGALKVKLSQRDPKAAIIWLEDVNGLLDRILAMHKQSAEVRK